MSKMPKIAGTIKTAQVGSPKFLRRRGFSVHWPHGDGKEVQPPALCQVRTREATEAFLLKLLDWMDLSILNFPL
jgi:hypothetical protein